MSDAGRYQNSSCGPKLDSSRSLPLYSTFLLVSQLHRNRRIRCSGGVTIRIVYGLLSVHSSLWCGIAGWP